MSKPLALELADALTSMPIGVSISKIEAAGEELRRLHAANEELAVALGGMLHLDEENHQRHHGDEDVCYEVRQARAALSKHKEQA